MSPQLAISSAFSIFALASLCVLGVNGGDSLIASGQPLMENQAETQTGQQAGDLPLGPLLPDLLP